MKIDDTAICMMEVERVKKRLQLQHEIRINIRVKVNQTKAVVVVECMFHYIVSHNLISHYVIMIFSPLI